MHQIQRARKDKKAGTIIHEIAGQSDAVFTDIRGGLAWPKETAPGYFCIVGERFQAGPMKKRPLALLQEYESNDFQDLLRVLTDTAIALACEDVYADLRPENECFLDGFYNYRREHQTAASVYVGQAPWVENFQYGAILIRDRMKANGLEIDRDSIVASQLGSITETAFLEKEKPEVEFYAVNALRFVVGAFQRSPWVQPEPDEIELYPTERSYPGYYKFD